MRRTGPVQSGPCSALSVSDGPVRLDDRSRLYIGPPRPPRRPMAPFVSGRGGYPDKSSSRISSSANLRPRISSSAHFFVSANLRPHIFVRKSSSANIRLQFLRLQLPILGHGEISVPTYIFSDEDLRTKICVDEEMRGRINAWTKKCPDDEMRIRRNARTKKCGDE